MEVCTRIVEREGRHFGELRCELTHVEGEEFPGDGPFGLLIEEGDLLLVSEVPDGLSPFAVTSAVEHKEDGVVLVFHLNSFQMTRLKSQAPLLFPDYYAGSRVVGSEFEIHIMPMSIELEDGEHDVLFVAPERFHDEHHNEAPPSFEPVVKDGVWQDDGFTRYMDRKLKLHEEPPAPPYLRLKGKEIVRVLGLHEEPPSPLYLRIRDKELVDRRVFLTVWELEGKAAKATYLAWVEERDRRARLESN